MAHVPVRCLLVVAATLLLPGLVPSRDAVPSSDLRSAVIAMTDDGHQVITVNPDSNSITIVDAASLAVVGEVDVLCSPQSLSIDGSRAFVACSDGVRVVDLDLRSLLNRIELRAQPFGVVAHDSLLYVSIAHPPRIEVRDASTLVLVTTIATEEFPRGLALDATRRRLYVSHFRSGRMSVIDLEARRVERVIVTENDGNLMQSLVLSDGGARVLVPQTRANSANMALLFDNTVFPVVSSIDTATGTPVIRERLALDLADRPVNMPLDLAVTPTKIYVVNAGSDDVSVVDRLRRSAVANTKVGSNPRGIVLSPDLRTAYVNDTLSGTISVIDTTTDRVTATISTTTIPLPPEVLRGKRTFHTSARPELAKDRWISCATCHFDGGTDGRTWFFRDGPRNTTSLFGVAETMPMHWSGDLDELEDVESTIRVVQAGTGLVTGPSLCEPACNVGPPHHGRSQDLDELAAFMATLRPPRLPAADAAAAARGSQLFFDANVGCASCHVPPLYTDRLRHDVGTGGSGERKGNSFDTPSLRGLADTAPYLHHGTAATLVDVLTTRNRDNRHGRTSTLTPAQLNDLAEFLRSIDFETPRRRTSRRLE